MSVLHGLTLTLVAYVVFAGLQRMLRGHPLVNPVLLSIIAIGVFLKTTGISYASYFAAAQPIHFLLGPATVALAVPLAANICHVRRNMRALVPALCAGSGVAALTGYLLVRFCAGQRPLALSMMPKAATTPIAIGVAEAIRGIPALTAVLAIAAGILVAVAMPAILARLRITSPEAIGFAAGTAGSGIGTARAFLHSELAGAFAGIGMGMNGLLTAVICPLLAHWLG